MTAVVGEPAPEIELTADDGRLFRLSEHTGPVLLVFYPGDDTPVCTAQLCDYRDGWDAFEGLGVEVVGVSHNDPESHRRFKSKYGLPFTLLSDPERRVAESYGCKGWLGTKRAVFLLDGGHRIRYAHIEQLAVFRRRREELVQAIEDAAL